MDNIVYTRIVDGEIIQTAKLRLLGIGKFAFETSLFCKQYEVNMNMPLFDTEKEARTWIEKLDGWDGEVKHTMQIVYRNYSEAAEAFRRGEIDQETLEALGEWFAEKWFEEK